MTIKTKEISVSIKDVIYIIILAVTIVLNYAKDRSSNNTDIALMSYRIDIIEKKISQFEKYFLDKNAENKTIGKHSNFNEVAQNLRRIKQQNKEKGYENN